LRRALAITFDVDWAPDWATQDCLDLCAKANVPATVFVTHKSPILAEMKESRLLEIGIHPNFFPNSSQGQSIGEVLAFCLEMAPNAKSMRSHSLLQSTRHFDAVAERYPQIVLDASIFAPHQTNVSLIETEFGADRRIISRLSTNWSDDYAASSPCWSWNCQPNFPEGVTILAFHPVQVALNTDRLERYDALKRSLGERSLDQATREDVAKFKNDGQGSRKFLERLFALRPQLDFLLISQTVAAFSSGGAPKLWP
jgi:hypothetical protein